MREELDHLLAVTRRSLHGVAELLLAGCGAEAAVRRPRVVRGRALAHGSVTDVDASGAGPAAFTRPSTAQATVVPMVLRVFLVVALLGWVACAVGITGVLVGLVPAGS